jgi:hypothetical protein
MEDFMEDILYHLKTEIYLEIANLLPIETQSLIESKLAYEIMMAFILHHHKEQITIPIMKNKQGTILYQDVRAIEEAVGLLSSVHHSISVRVREYKNQLDHEPWKHNCLIDNNENRKFLIFGVEDEVSECEYLDNFHQSISTSLSDH